MYNTEETSRFSPSTCELHNLRIATKQCGKQERTRFTKKSVYILEMPLVWDVTFPGSEKFARSWNSNWAVFEGPKKKHSYLGLFYDEYTHERPTLVCTQRQRIFIREKMSRYNFADFLPEQFWHAVVIIFCPENRTFTGNGCSSEVAIKDDSEGNPNGQKNRKRITTRTFS